MIQAVMVDGPKSGEVIRNDAGFGEVMCFALPLRTDLPGMSLADYDPHAPTWNTAVYRRRGRVAWPGNTIDVFTFDGLMR